MGCEARRRAALGCTVLALLAAGALRVAALGQDRRFHPDEALFATFARSAAVQGEWLLPGPLDKPPLAITAHALAMTAFGVSTLPDGVLTLEVRRGEFAVRLGGVFASLLTAAFTAALAQRLWRSAWAGLAAAWLMALSPLALAFSATGFTDGWLLVGVSAALWAAARPRWLAAGCWLALGLACKAQAVLLAPLVLALGWAVGGWPGWQALLRWAAPLALLALVYLIWESVRGAPSSVLALAAANNDPTQFAAVADWAPRLGEWLRYGGLLLGPPLVTAALLTLAGLALPRLGWRGAALLGCAALYSLGHVLLALPLYDRYLLLLLPVVVVLVAGGAVVAGEQAAQAGQARQTGRTRRCAPLLVLALLVSLPTAWAAVQGRLAVGGDRGRHDGIDRLAAFVDETPLGTIVYDRWLGWPLGYYLGVWSDKRRVYYPTPFALAAGARAQMDAALRLFVAPDWQDARPWLSALRGVGFDVHLVYAEGPFRAWLLAPPWRSDHKPTSA